MVRWYQVNALMRKSWAYQRKNVCSNIAIVIAPVFIATLLGVLQTVLNRLQKDDGKCGCQCVRCEVGDRTVSTDIDECNGLYSPACLERNEAICGIEWTDYDDISYCEFSDPVRFPPLYDTSSSRNSFGSPDYSDYSDYDRDTASSPGPASASAPQTSRPLDFMYTSANPTFADAMMQRLWRQPDPLALIKSPEMVTLLQTGLDEDLALLNRGVDLSFVANADWDIGSSSSLSTLYFDKGFIHSPVTVAANCELYKAAFPGALSSTGGPFFKQLEESCIDGRLDAVEDGDTINQRLFCMDNRADSAECPERVPYGHAIDLKDSGPGRLAADIWSDSNWDDALKRLNKPIERIANVWLQEWLGEEYGSRLLALTDMPKPETQLRLDFASIVGPLLYVWLIQLPLPWAVVQLVHEKQHRLRSMMRMHGLDNGAYITVMYMYFLLQYTIYIIVMIAAGVAANLNYFKLNSVGVQLVFYFMYGNVQIAFAFLLSCFFSHTRTANISVWIWILGAGMFAAQLLRNIFVEGRWFAELLELIPTFGAYRGLWELGEFAFRATYNDDVGMGFGDLRVNGNGMGILWLIFILQWLFFMVLAWYLEQVFDSGVGVRRHWLFPLHCLRSRKIVADTDERRLDDSALPSDVGHLEEDVLCERHAALTTDPSTEVPIVVRDLRKVFPRQDGNTKKVAVRNMSLAISAGECFGLLGPNGAGKSTGINMMIGFLEATKGDAFINGVDIKEDMSAIHRGMGVCPQDNLLWETLTAQEHLFFYARLKSLTGAAAAAAVDGALRSVQLCDVRNKCAGKFSGGMKRRLSVAIALIGSPGVAYLDEPSTGLDPAARRQLWDVVRHAKKDKAMVLTTHSMQEAEELCDRLGIFIDGRLVCLGNPKYLIARYGGYYVFTITTTPEEEGRVHEFVLGMSPNAQRTYVLGGTFKYEVPCSDTTLSVLFDYMATAVGQELTVLDWGAHSASLEDVFIRLAQHENEAEGAAAAGNA